MNMHSPIVAMLWENWRLTRVEAAQRTGLGIVAASAALFLLDAGTKVAFLILIVLHGMFWLSISKLNGGRFLDGYKPGFPLHLLYTRPVPTVVFVGVAMAYDAVSCVALYLVSAALVGFAFGQPLPLFSITVWIVTLHLACTCIQWSTRNRFVQWIGMIAICLPLSFLLSNSVASPLRVEFSFAENVMLILIGVVSFGVAVAGVAHQRHGGASAPTPRAAGTAGFPDWLVNLFHFSCPTSSAMRAQLWFELKSSGLPVLTIGLGFAMLIFLLFAISIAVAPVRPFAVFSTMISVPVVLLLFGGNAFGIRQRQGRTYVSAFEATRPYGTAQLSGLKLLVRSVCLLVALIAISMSAWASSSLISAWGSWVVDGEDLSVGLLRLRRDIRDTFGGLTAYELVALAVVMSIAVALMVASRAVFTALRARYSRRVNIALSLLASHVFALILLMLARRRGLVSELLLDGILSATNWIAATAPIIVTIYLAWCSLAERMLTPRQMWSIVLLSATFGAACLTLIGLPRVQPVGFPEGLVLARWLPQALMALMVGVLVPWSFSRIRHL